MPDGTGFKGEGRHGEARNALAGALAIELPQEDFQSISEQDKSDIEEKMERTEAPIAQLIGYFHGRGYEAAATYMRRAKIGMFGYIRRWLKWGLFSPRASSRGLAKTHGYHRQRGHQRWKLQVFCSKFGTITKKLFFFRNRS